MLEVKYLSSSQNSVGTVFTFSCRSEALQRSGRAGRTATGKCFRIYSKDFWNQCMPDHVIPEIKRTSLTSVVLTLKCLAIHDVIRYVGNPERAMARTKEACLFLGNCSVSFD